MRDRNTLVKRLLAVSISVVIGLSGVSTSMAESYEVVLDGTSVEENLINDGQTETSSEEDYTETQEGVEETIENETESESTDKQEIGTEETIDKGIEIEVEVTVTPTPEPTETPVVEEQRETFDYDSAYQSLTTIWKEGTDSRRDQVVLSALKKVDSVKYLKGAGHTEDYIGLYGLTGVESSLYLVDNSEFLDDTGLVAATLRSVGFLGESDWIASEGADFGSRSDLFSPVDSNNDLLQGDIGIDTEGVVGIYCGNDTWVYSDYSTGWVEFDDCSNRVFNQYWTLTGYSDSIESSSEKDSNQNSEGVDLDSGKKDLDSGDTESSEENTKSETKTEVEGDSENSGITIENTSEGVFDENGIEIKEDAEEPKDDSIEKKADEIDGINGAGGNENLVSTVADTNKVVGDSYISSAMIKEKIDGTTPFDSDNNPGNDSDEKNNIVRSFDTINYTLDYVTAIRGDEVINEAKLYVRFILPCTKEYAQFDMDTMKWMQDAKLQTTEKGNQILTGYRYLQNTGDTNMIPGAGTLSVGIGVKAAPNGTIIKPSFILEMEGSSDKSVILTDETVVSAYPRYNIKLSRNGNCDSLGWYDTNDGSVSLKQKSNTLKGRLFGYGIGLMLYNTSADKKLKGIELPTGDLTFDLTTTHSSNGVNMSGDTNYQVVLWDYKENESYNSTGHLNRNMTPMNTWVQGAYPWSMPGNKRGSTDQFCYDGGTVSVSQDSSNIDLYHLTIKDYKFDTDKWIFPIDGMHDTPYKQFSDNIGYFAVDYVQFLVTFPEVVDEIKNIDFEVRVGNLNVKSKSGLTVTEEVTDDDNYSSVLATVYPSGSIDTRHFFLSSDGWYKSNPWSNGNSSAFLGENIIINANARYRGDGYLTKFHHLQKFDDRIVRVTRASHNINNGGMSTITDENILYAAKPDKSGWVDENEMRQTSEENLIYFKNVEELYNSGYTCVGVLSEFTGELYYSGDGSMSDLYTYCTLTKDTSYSGKVYMTCSELRAWRDINDISNILDIEDIPYTGVDGISQVYGIGDSSYTIGNYDERISPYFHIQYTGYRKTTYKDGNITGGHTNGCQQGNSLLLIGYKAYIDKKVGNRNTDGSTKLVFDMDKNEREVRYNLYVRTEVQEKLDETAYTNLTVSDTIPKDLEYVVGSSYFGRDAISPTVTKNSDGTTTLIWKLNNVEVGIGYSAITFSCKIGKAGTSDDVDNNQIITNIARVTGDGDNRQVSESNGNLSSASFNVIKLSSVSLSKTTDTPFVDLGDAFRYSFRFANTSDNMLKNAHLYDVLPWNGDRRNSDFGGDYSVSSIVLDFVNAPKSFIEYKDKSFKGYIKATDSTGIRSTNFTFIKNFSSWNVRGSIVIDENAKTITFKPNKENIKAFTFVCSLYGNEYITTTINMRGYSVTGNDQKEGDAYVNTVYEDSEGQSKEVVSNRAVVQVYGQIKITKVYDDDENSKGKRPDKITVNVLQNGKIYRSVDFDNTETYPCMKVLKSVPLYDENGDLYTYTVEEKNPNGYFAVVSGSKSEGFTVTNTLVKTTVKKVDVSGNGIKDAKLQILKMDGSVVKEWTTGDNGVYELYGDLNVGEKYKIHEVEAPNGFTVADDIEFTVAESADGNVYTMVDNYSTFKVKMSKQDVDGNSLGGSELEITGRAVGESKDIEKITWVSEDGKDKKVDLKPGTYVMHEVKAPTGYKLAKDVRFDVDTDGKIKVNGNEVESVVMIDKEAVPTSGSVTITKYAEDGKTVVPGVTFNIHLVEEKDVVEREDGEIDKTPWKDIEKTTGADGKVIFNGLRPGVYEVIETKTVKGMNLLADKITLTIPLSATEKEVIDKGMDTSKAFYSRSKKLYYFFNFEYNVTNGTSFDVPLTGGFGGNTMVLLIGMLVVIISISMVFKKKKCD